MNSISITGHMKSSLRDKVNITSFGMTDIGKVREVNQDHFVIGDLNKHIQTEASSVELDGSDAFGQPMGKLLLVADGMGGANAGEVASELAIKATVSYLLNSMHWLYNPSQPEIEQFIEDLKKAACFSHDTVKSGATEAEDRYGMGSTLTVAYVVWPMLYVLHVGDSRCYLLHQNRLGLLTRDQTFAQFLFDEGHLSQEQFDASPYQNVLLNAIGIDGDADASVYQQRLDYGDKILLCTDGVNRHLTDDQILEVLKQDSSPESICQTLVDKANGCGGQDNITTVVAHFTSPRNQT